MKASTGADDVEQLQIRSGTHLTDQSCPTVEHRQELVRLLWRKRRNHAGDAEVAKPLQLSEVFGNPADCHWQRLRIAPGFGGHLAKARQVFFKVGAIPGWVPA